MTYIGIDPGKAGALAVIREDGFVCATYPFDETSYVKVLADVVSESKDIEHHSDVFAIVEDVHAMPKQGSVSMFSFGKNFGWIQGLLCAYGIPFQLVRPYVWKKTMGCNSDKSTSVSAARRMFAGVSLKRTERCVKDDDGIAEALLMAEYGRRIHR